MNGIAKVVVSATLREARWHNTKIINGSVLGKVSGLKRENARDIFIFGSASLSSTLMQANLIDEYRIGLNPVVLGGGNPLFKPSQIRTKMKLLEAKPLEMGCVILRYQPVPGEGAAAPSM